MSVLKDGDAGSLIQFVAHMCHNMPTDIAPAARLLGHETRILEAFNSVREFDVDRNEFVFAAWNLSAAIVGDDE